MRSRSTVIPAQGRIKCFVLLAAMCCVFFEFAEKCSGVQQLSPGIAQSARCRRLLAAEFQEPLHLELQSQFAAGRFGAMERAIELSYVEGSFDEVVAEFNIVLFLYGDKSDSESTQMLRKQHDWFIEREDRSAKSALVKVATCSFLAQCSDLTVQERVQIVRECHQCVGSYRKELQESFYILTSSHCRLLVELEKFEETNRVLEKDFSRFIATYDASSADRSLLAKLGAMSWNSIAEALPERAQTRHAKVVSLLREEPFASRLSFFDPYFTYVSSTVSTSIAWAPDHAANEILGLRTELEQLRNSTPEQFDTDIDGYLTVLDGLETRLKKSIGRQKLVGKTAPGWQDMPDVDSESVRLADLKGKVVILEFWATWCPPCLQSIEILKDLLQDYEPKGLVVVAVAQPRRAASAEEMTRSSASKLKAEVKAFLVKHEVPFISILDQSGNLADAYSVYSIPQPVIIDRHGVVSLVPEYATDGTSERLIVETVERLLLEN